MSSRAISIARGLAQKPRPRRGNLRALVSLVALGMALGSCLISTVCQGAPEQDSSARAAEIVVVELYTRQGCPRCAEAKAFLDALSNERPEIHVVEHRVDKNLGARRELEQRLRDAGITVAGVPAFVVRGRVLVGFEDAGTTGERIKALVNTSVPADTGSGATLPQGTKALPGNDEAPGSDRGRDTDIRGS